MSSQKEHLMQEAEASLLKTYNKFPIVLESGKGVYLYDSEGKEYLDGTAGIAVSGLGYGNEEFNQAIKDQVDKLLHTSNLYYNETGGKAAKALAKASGMDKVFFTNSGTEAIEGALKVARKHAYAKENKRFSYIAMNHSFHGRSMGALSVTGNEAYRAPFAPNVPGVSFAEFNDLDSVKALVDETTCAIIVEPLQGEGGIYLAEEAFLQGLRAICDENDMLLIFDEIQCGMGRTGHMFLWQKFNVKPDIICMAKAIGNGVPVGAFAMTEEVATSSLTPGDHGTTYGGNPFVCAAICKVLEIFERDQIVSHVQEIGEYLSNQLDLIVKDYSFVTERRGLGLLQGLQLNIPVGGTIQAALKEGLLVISAGSDVIRMVPPLIYEKKHVDELIEKLRRALEE